MASSINNCLSSQTSEAAPKKYPLATSGKKEGRKYKRKKCLFRSNLSKEIYSRIVHRDPATAGWRRETE